MAKPKNNDAPKLTGTSTPFIHLASVFASRLAPELTDAVLKSYLDSKLGLSVNVECVKATDWHTSFHITCRCENTAVFMHESIWPEGD